MFDRLIGGDVEGMYPFVCAILHECLLLGWPEHYIANALKSIPKRHQSPLVRALRVIGRSLKKVPFHSLVSITEIADKLQADSLHGAILDAMAPAPAQESKQHFSSPFPFTKALLRLLREWLEREHFEQE